MNLQITLCNFFRVSVWGLAVVSLLDRTDCSPSDSDDSNVEQESELSSWSFGQNITLDCAELRPGQYYCDDPIIDEKTQQPANCSKDSRTARVKCYPVPGIVCNSQDNGFEGGFYKSVPCKWTNGHSFSVAVLLSVFLGMFGVDRFYLGYPAIGLLKLCTLGFMFLGQLVDILLIALQVVGPSDGSEYVIDYYGPGLTYVGRDNFTYIPLLHPPEGRTQGIAWEN